MLLLFQSWPSEPCPEAGDIQQAGLAGRVALERTPTNLGGRCSLVPWMIETIEDGFLVLGFWIVDSPIHQFMISFNFMSYHFISFMIQSKQLLIHYVGPLHVEPPRFSVIAEPWLFNQSGKGLWVSWEETALTTDDV